MRRRTTITATALAVGLLATATACSDEPAASSQPAAEVTDSLVGEWTMTTLEVGTAGDLAEVPYSGQVSFSEAGTMSVQAMNPDTTAPDTAFTVGGYEAYYGPVDVDPEAGTFVIDVQSAAVRDLIGQQLTRAFDVDGDTLVLTPTDPAEGFRVTYERAGS